MKEPEDSLKRTRLALIGELGAAGRKEAPYVVERLTDEDWDVRAAAARTLGLIGHADAAPQLAAAITPHDWQLTLEAMVSLAKLKAPQTDAVLKNIASSYWLPSIAETANDIAAGHLPSIPSFQHSQGYCNAIADQALIPKCPSPNATDDNRYDVEIRAYRQAFWQEFYGRPSLKGASKAPLALDLADGKLVGTNHGEWGGELGFVNDEVTQTIIDDNILALVKRGDRIFAVSGLIGRAKGDYLWEVLKTADGKWSARRLWRLPGPPNEVVAAPDGTIGFLGEFGSVLYRTNDTLQWLACGPSDMCRR